MRHPLGSGCVGIDIGPQTIAYSAETEVNLVELADRVQNIEQQKRILQRKIERSRRANNPENYKVPGGQVVVRMAGEEVAVHDAASGPSRPINYDPDHYGQALEGKRGLADADIAEAARANLALLDSLGGA